MFTESIDSLAAHLDRLITSKTVVGDPIVSGNTTIIPILNAGFGFGAGGGEGTEPSKGAGKGGGSGAGVSLKPTALVVIQGDDVKVYSLSQKGTLEKLAEMMPTVMSKMKDMCKDSGCCE
ncbi:MAG: sporulation protein [Firmicutes bacterium]|nr:sporulation protein [Bacillota bacterium]